MSGLLYPSNLPGLTFDNIRSYKWKSGEQRALSDKASFIAYVAYPRVHFELVYELLRDGATPDIKALVGLHNAMLGRADTFLYTDPEFNSVTASQFGVSDGTTTTRYQIIASYQQSGGPGSPEAIQNFNGTPQLFDNGTLISGTHYVIDALGGVTFSTPPTTAHVLTWTGSFYYRCRFDADEIDWTKFLSGMWKADTVAFTSELL